MTLTTLTCLYLHLSLSPSIPTSSYLPIFYLIGFQEEREEMREVFCQQLVSLIFIAVDVAVCFKYSRAVILTYLGDTVQHT